MRKIFTQFYLLLLAYFVNTICVWAEPSQTTYHIKVDQFGYLPNAKKVAVIADPQKGYNAAETFRAGKNPNQYQVRRWEDNIVVFSGTITAWKNGLTHTQSGDKGWWFDFSAVTTPGSYYVFDAANNVGSFRFEIAENVYDEVLKQAMRTFYYQRLNQAKEQPFTDARWADAASFEGANQDRFATSRFAKGDMATAEDVHGGWMDAGDVNKYTTFALAPVMQLMEAYRINSSVFKDNYDIPESGNGIPDLLDEVKWELDFFKRMQDATGTNGFLLKVGVDNYDEVTPLSLDKRPRYYLPECTSGTIAGCAMFAVSGVTLKEVPALSTYAQDLINRAELAWARAKVTTNNFTTFDLDCDDGDIKAGDADNTAVIQFDNAVAAAVYLYEATGKAEYKGFAEANYSKVNLYSINWWGPFWMPQHLALLRLTTLHGISSGVVANIRSQKANMDYQNSITDYTQATDLYRAHINDDQYSWGHNQYRANAGNMNLDYVTFNINPDRHALYKEVAEQYLHWMHGANPMGMVMLSNMYQYGGEKCVNEIYHTWFRDGSVWDNALVSPNGPAPGFVTGGPNKDFTGAEAGISDQPYQKAYKDWNTGWPSGAWEITENAIYYQAAYVSLLARLMLPDNTLSTPADNEAPSIPLNLIASAITDHSLTLTWTPSSDNNNVAGYDIYRNQTLLQANVSELTYTVNGLDCNTSYSFSVKARDAAGNISDASNTETAVTDVCLILVTDYIYDEQVGLDWVNELANATANFNNTITVKVGARAIKVDYAGNGTLAFRKGAGLQTTVSTQLRFWVYNTNRSNIKVFTEDIAGVKSREVVFSPTRQKWVEIIISMNQLGDPATIGRVTVQNNTTSAVTVYLDEMQLTNVAELTSNTIKPLAMLVNGSAGKLDAVPGKGITIYPNPISDQACIQIQATEASFATMQLLDITGRIFLQEGIWVSPGATLLRLDTSKLAPGTYLIRMIIDKTNYTKKIIKE